MARIYKNPGPLTFKAIITRNTSVSNSSAFVAFPYDLKETFGVGNLVPCKVLFDERISYQGSLAKMGGTHALLLLRKDVRAQLTKDAGDEVVVRLELDDQPRQIAVPADLIRALQHAGYWELFQALSYSHQKEYVQWIEGAKQPATRERRIHKACEMLGQAKKSPY
jgi:hypothetical protein